MPLPNIIVLLEFWSAVFGLVIVGLVALSVALYLGIQWWKHKDREKESLEFVKNENETIFGEYFCIF